MASRNVQTFPMKENVSNPRYIFKHRLRILWNICLCSGCNQLCENDNECQHNCSATPQGPTCFCSADQLLAADSKNCMQPRSIEETGKWNTEMLVVTIVLGLALVSIIILVSFKYWQARVRAGFSKYLHLHF